MSIRRFNSLNVRPMHPDLFQGRILIIVNRVTRSGGGFCVGDTVWNPAAAWGKNSVCIRKKVDISLGQSGEFDF
jgi:hypothetical protein